MKGNKLKYHEKWFEYGFITRTIFDNQIAEFEKGEDSNEEHYRYKRFQDFIEQKTGFKDEEIINFIHLVELDNDQSMASSALSELFRSEKLTSSQINIVAKKLTTYGNWARKLIEKKVNNSK